jgi:hypothetical protein
VAIPSTQSCPPSRPVIAGTSQVWSVTPTAAAVSWIILAGAGACSRLRWQPICEPMKWALGFPCSLGSGEVLLQVIGVALTLVGMAWLSRLAPAGDYLAAVALPMVFIGVGQGPTFAPMTGFGIADVGAGDAGAASGLLNTAHQLGMALGLGILVTLAAHAGTDQVAARVGAALTGSSILLALGVVAAQVTTIPSRAAARRQADEPALVRPKSRERQYLPLAPTTAYGGDMNTNLTLNNGVEMPALGFGGLQTPPRGSNHGGRGCAADRLPPHRHRGRLRQRAWRWRGSPPLRRGPV